MTSIVRQNLIRIFRLEEWFKFLNIVLFSIKTENSQKKPIKTESFLKLSWSKLCSQNSGYRQLLLNLTLFNNFKKSSHTIYWLIKRLLKYNLFNLQTTQKNPKMYWKARIKLSIYDNNKSPQDEFCFRFWICQK